MGFMVVQWDLMVIYCDSMGFNGDLWWFNGIQWDLMIYTLWCHQAWLTGKSPIHGGFNGTSPINGPSSTAMFDYRR